MDPASQENTGFTTYSGPFEFKKMPFGSVYAPATFQRLMEYVLEGLVGKGCLVYLNDALVFGASLEEHNSHLQRVLEHLRGANLRMKPSKCHFAQETVQYLGHIVSATGVSTDPKKLQAVVEFPTPCDVKSLRSFLGLASYYRRFIPNFSKEAGPLYALTKKGVDYVLNEKCQVTFERFEGSLDCSSCFSLSKL